MKQLKSKRTDIAIVLIACLLFPLFVSAQKQEVSCVGNSITYGYELSDPYNQSYPGQLRTLLGTTNWTVGNFGDSGRSLLKGSGYSYWDSQLYKNALASNPNQVILKLGTNDAKRWLWNWLGTNFKTDYKAMVQSFQNLSSKPEIWICLLIPGEKADWDIFNADIKNKVNPKIKEVALEMGLNLIDLYAEFGSINPEWYLPDSIHPSVPGAGVIAAKVKEMLLMPKPEVTFANGKVTAPDGIDFQWYINGSPVTSANGGKLKEMTVTESGNYKVSIKISADNETRIVSKELIVSLSGLDSKAAVSGIKVFPNPAFDVLNVRFDDQSATAGFSISDLAGKTVLSGQIMNGRDSIDISMISAGTYMLAIGSECIKVVKK